MKIIFSLIILLGYINININAQTVGWHTVAAYMQGADNQSYSRDSIPDMKFHLSQEPQGGYTFLLGFRGGFPVSEKDRFIWEFGVAKTSIRHTGEGGITDKYLTFELNEIDKKYYYGVGAGINLRSFMDLGLSLNYLTNFAGGRTVSLRPSMGFCFLPPMGSIYVEAGCDISVIRPNFDLLNHWMIGIRYNIGFIKSKEMER